MSRPKWTDSKLSSRGLFGDIDIGFWAIFQRIISCHNASHPITIYTCMHLVCLILHPTRNIFPNTSKTWKLPWCFQNRLAIKMPFVLVWSLEVAFMGCTHPKTNIAPRKMVLRFGSGGLHPLKSWNLGEGQDPFVCTSLKWPKFLQLS